MWLLTLEGKVSFHQMHTHITHSHIITLKYTYTHSQRHMYEHIVTFEKSPQYALWHASSSPHISWSLGLGTMSVLPRGKKSEHLCTLSWTQLHISLRSLNKSLLHSKEWHPSSGKLPDGQGDHFDQELDLPSAQHHTTWITTYMPYAKLVLHMWQWHLEGQPTIHVYDVGEEEFLSSAGVQLSRTMRLHMAKSLEGCGIITSSIHPSILTKLLICARKCYIFR